MQNNYVISILTLHEGDKTTQKLRICLCTDFITQILPCFLYILFKGSNEIMKGFSAKTSVNPN